MHLKFDLSVYGIFCMLFWQLFNRVVYFLLYVKVYHSFKHTRHFFTFHNVHAQNIRTESVCQEESFDTGIAKKLKKLQYWAE